MHLNYILALFCLPSDDNISNSDVDKISNHIKKFHETVVNNKL